MRLLDLFCGAGGAAMGYHRAGFQVIGVDLNPQPNYPFEFHQADALEYPLNGFDAIHASPPCQAYTAVANRWRGKGGKADRRPKLIHATRDRLNAAGVPYVIENVETARADLTGNTVRVCGSTVGLAQSRHRLFECGGWHPLVPPCGCRGREFKGVYGKRPDGRWIRKDSAGVRRNYIVSSLEEGPGAARHRLDGVGRAPRGDPARVHGTDRPSTDDASLVERRQRMPWHPVDPETEKPRRAYVAVWIDGERARAEYFDDPDDIPDYMGKDFPHHVVCFEERP